MFAQPSELIRDLTISFNNGSSWDVIGLHEGDYFGETTLRSPSRHSFSYRAGSFCELYFLSRTIFLETCQSQMNEEDSQVLLREHASPSRRRSASSDGVHGDHGMLSKREAMMISPSKSTLLGSAEDEKSWMSSHLHPGSQIRLYWAAITFACVLYYMFSCPLLLSVSFNDEIVLNFSIIFGLAYLSDVVMITNLILDWTAFPFVEDGVLRCRHLDIRVNFYAKRVFYHDLLQKWCFSVI